MDFTKDNIWVYANAVSVVCVSDDEVCLSVPCVLTATHQMVILGEHRL